ncbi:NAD(P)H-dependent oxidoreductase [Bradyrhizobium sp. 147]|nr:NAD(P)H-dependent oxidoreductase [Bradyrhizobium sp. 147]
MIRCLVVGLPKPASRRIREQLVVRLFPPGSYDRVIADLADHAEKLFRWPYEEIAKLDAAVASSQLAVFASPTYKATFAGLLKEFLHRYPACGRSHGHSRLAHLIPEPVIIARFGESLSKLRFDIQLSLRKYGHSRDHRLKVRQQRNIDFRAGLFPPVNQPPPADALGGSELHLRRRAAQSKSSKAGRSRVPIACASVKNLVAESGRSFEPFSLRYE